MTSKKLPFSGSLYKDRNGFYIYQLSYNYKRKQISTGTKDYKLAVQTARKLYPNIFNELRYPTKKTLCARFNSFKIFFNLFISLFSPSPTKITLTLSKYFFSRVDKAFIKSSCPLY